VEVILYTARWCWKCEEIVKIIEKSGTRLQSVVLDDSPEGVSKLKEKTGNINVPAFDLDGTVIFGYFPRRLSILLKAKMGARDHPPHQITRKAK
jgi:glutaredoxin